MKNLVLFSASVAAVLAVGCNKVEPAQTSLHGDGQKCQLTLKLNDAVMTRATGQTIAKESTIQNIQIFVFRSGTGNDAGVLDACISKGFDSPLNFDASSVAYEGVSLDCTVGQRKIYAVVNSDVDYTSSAQAIGTESALLAKTIALSSMASDKLFMIQSVETTLKPGDETVGIEVRRKCASVVLQSVKNDMQANIYRKDNSFKIRNVYLTNVPAKINFGMTLSPSSLPDADWYARTKSETDGTKAALILDANATGTVIGYGKEYSVEHRFYAFPNDCAPSVAATWCPRATRLVIEASYYDGSVWHECYYPITLYDKTSSKGLEANKQYKVNLTVRRPGSDDPDKPVEFDTVAGSITVANWETGTSYTETI